MRHMPSVALVSCLVAAALAASSGASPGASPNRYAQFVLQIDVAGPSGSIQLAGRGAADAQEHRAQIDLSSANGLEFQTVVSSVAHLTVFLTGGSVTNLPDGKTWARSDGAAAAPLFDPGVPLRIAAPHGTVLGTATIGGVAATEYAIVVHQPEAALLAPAAPASVLAHGLPAKLWLDPAGHPLRFTATVPFGKATAAIDETLSGFGEHVYLKLPPASAVWDPRVDKVTADVRSAIPSIESYRADNDSGGRYDPSKTETGYEGMTVAYLRKTYDLSLRPQLRIVRATRTSYCVEETRDGITVMKNGPSAPFVVGRHC